MNDDKIIDMWLFKESQIVIPYTHIAVPSYYRLGNSAVKVVSKLGLARGIEVEDVSGANSVFPVDAFTTPITLLEFNQAVADYRRNTSNTTAPVIDPNASPLSKILVVPNPITRGVLMSEIAGANPETVKALQDGLNAGGTPLFRKNDLVNATVSFNIGGEPHEYKIRTDRLLVKGTTESLKDWMIAHAAELQAWEQAQRAARPGFLQNIGERLTPRRRYASTDDIVDKWIDA